MLSFLNRRRAAERVAFDAPLRPERRVYAIGDVHGRADLLERLLVVIDADLEGYDGTAELVFLGDYVDRGEDSRTVLDLLTALKQRSALPTVFLKGNHEDMLLGFLQDPARGQAWLRYGGLQTLMSYGVGIGRGDEALEDARDRLMEAMAPHLDFLSALDMQHRSGNVLFVHAGADPELPPPMQTEGTLLWGCGSFFSKPREDGLWVVHGHTIVSAAHSRAGRIAVDTGAYYSGRLSAARIEQDGVAFLQS